MAAQAAMEHLRTGNDHSADMAAPGLLAVEGHLMRAPVGVVLLHCAATVHANTQAEAGGRIEKVELRGQRGGGSGRAEKRKGFGQTKALQLHQRAEPFAQQRAR